MGRITKVICPYVKGTNNGAMCGAADRLVKDMEGFTTRLCLSRHYEACILYVAALKEEIVRPALRSHAGEA